MPLHYPEITLVKDALPRHVVEAYCSLLRGRTLPALGSRCAAMFGGIIAAQVIDQQFNISTELVLSKCFDMLAK